MMEKVTIKFTDDWPPADTLKKALLRPRRADLREDSLEEGFDIRHAFEAVGRSLIELINYYTNTKITLDDLTYSYISKSGMGIVEARWGTLYTKRMEINPT